MAERPSGRPVRARHYVSFPHDGDEWMFDLTFLTSSWTCIFGNGCQGVLTGPAPELGHGCCSYGAHFTDDADLQRVAEAASRLTDAVWQHRQQALRRGGPFKRQGQATVSRLVDGACIFLNGPDAPQGHGCALHIGAVAAGERPLDWKPDVCWQLPLRMTYHQDENERGTHTLRSWDRDDWGAGGQEFHWWCTEADDAFVGHTPVYIELRDEIVALVGAERYQLLVDQIEQWDRATPVPPPSLKKRAAPTDEE
jgi:hypothetical protein